MCDTFFFAYLLCALRDGGLKRAKVKDAFKAEQQKLYSKVLVGDQDQDQEDQSDNKILEDENPEEDKNSQDSRNEMTTQWLYDNL